MKPSNTGVVGNGKKTGEIWTYWITRDSYEGKLEDSFDLWGKRPLRVSRAGRTTWIAESADNPGHLGMYSQADLKRFDFGTLPETDMEIIRLEVGVTEKMKRECK